MSKANSAIAGGAAGFQMGGALGAAIGAGAGLLLGQDDNSGEYYDQLMRMAAGIPLPVLKEQHPELYAQLAQFNPEMDQAISLGPSAMGGIALDPAYKQAQMSALAKLQNITDNNGQDAQSMADNARLQNEINSQLQGNTGAIQQNMATRGLSGGMSEMVAKQMAAQQAANRQAQMGMDINAQAQQRALAALSQQGQLGGQLSQQDFSQQAQKAQAADAIAQFNARNSQNVQSSNVAARNQAQQQNLINAQNIHNQNVDTKNRAAEWNTNGKAQQEYANQLQRIGLQGNALQGMAQNSSRQAQAQDQFIGGVASGAAQYGAQQRMDETNQKRWDQLMAKKG